MPENTTAAMLKALDLGVTSLELDVVITKDKKVVLSHEPWFSMEITTKPDGSYMGLREERKFNIYWMTYEEVKTFDVGLKPHPGFPDQQKIKAVKPLLTEVIDSSDEHARKTNRALPFYNIEIKIDPLFDGVFQPKPDEFSQLVISVIKAKGIEERCMIQSFDFRPLQWLHQNFPAIKIGMLINGFDRRSLDEQLVALGFTPTFYAPHYSLVNSSLIKNCHEKNMKIIPWTVNDKEKIDRLIKLGVDGIITDYPNLLDN
jgi:glycerophosphoryl diester phosphodiesterase